MSASIIPNTPQDPPPAFDAMVDHLSVAARDVFADFGVTLQGCSVVPADDDAEEPKGMAIIGYAGDGVRGALVMLVPEHAIRTWMVAAGVPDGDVADTLGEFSNMLLGRLKERLLPLGIAIFATTPTAVTGHGLRLSESPGPSAWSAFEGPGWNLKLRLDASFSAGFAPVDEAPVSWQPKAGDGLDFDTW